MTLFRERVNLAGCAAQLPLGGYTPALSLDGLQPGVDNVRHDVFLSPRFVELTRAHLAQLIVQYGEVKDVAAPESREWRPPSVISVPGRDKPREAETPDFKSALADLHTVALNRAKNEGNPSLEMLCRLAVVKFLRAEMQAQFATALDRCRARLKSYEGPRQAAGPKGEELRERTARFQMAKKAILRRIGQELFELLREHEKTLLGRLRRSLFGEDAVGPELFLNRLLFTEDGRDDFINAEHYVMLGNYHQDPDRFARIERIAAAFLESLGCAGDLDALLNEPENAHLLLAAGEPDAATAEGRVQKAALNAWVERLEREDVMERAAAAYEVVALLSEYAPRVNPQQLKNALTSRSERKRLEGLLEDQGGISAGNLRAAMGRVARCRGAERARIAARFLRDFLRYHRDLRRLETVNAALDAVNLVGSDKLRELSAINYTLYEFPLAAEQKPAEPKVIHHVILKADVRDSTELTRSLLERGLNPASHFSLNFYEPINKLLPRYGAQKLFIEGDAIILALFEQEGEPAFGVGRACVLAKEIIEIVRGYNEHSRKAGLPVLELGIGIAYQDAAPMYLTDGGTRIMISPALNASDRLSSCSKSARRLCAGIESLFNVFVFQTVDDADTAGQPDEFLIRYNLGGIVLDDAAFAKFQQEVSVARCEFSLPMLWDEGAVQLYAGLVPVAPGVFHKVVIREARTPHIDARTFQLKDWTDRKYYELCTNPAIYEFMEAGKSAGAGR